MTPEELKLQIDTQITNKTSARSITPTNVGNNMKDVVDFVPLETINNLTTTKVDKEAGKSLISDTEITKLSHLDDTTDLQKPVSTAQQAAIDAAVQAQLVDSTLINGVTETSAVPPTGNIHAIGVGTGTYPNWGGMVIPANNIGTLQRVGGVYSVSLTAIAGLDAKLNISDIVDDLVSTDVNKPLSANQGRNLADAIGGASIISTQTFVPNNVLTEGDGYSANIIENQFATTSEEKDYFDLSFVRNSGTANILIYTNVSGTFTLIDTITPLDNGSVQTFRINQTVPIGARIAVVGNVQYINSPLTGVGLKAYEPDTFNLSINFPDWECAYSVVFYKDSGFVLNNIPSLIAGIVQFPKYPNLYNKIGVSGTSITFGIGATGGHDGTNKWIYLFNQTLNNVLGRTITIVDGGISGQTSAGMLSNLPALLAQNPQIHLLEMSINDAKIDGNGQTFAQSESNYRDMISLCQADDIVPVLFTCWPLDMANTALGDLTTIFSQSKRTDLNNLARKLSAELNVQLIDLDLVCSQNYDLMGDGLHPQDIGHLWGANVISAGIIQNGTL